MRLVSANILEAREPAEQRPLLDNSLHTRNDLMTNRPNKAQITNRVIGTDAHRPECIDEGFVRGLNLAVSLRGALAPPSWSGEVSLPPAGLSVPSQMWAVPLPAVLLFSCCLAFAQIRVRIWQPDKDSSTIVEPTRFFDFVQHRSVPSTTYSATSEPGVTTQENTGNTAAVTTSNTVDTSTINSVPSTVHWAPPTTVNACGETDPTALIETLKDSGVYNEIYMAPDILTASRNFPDLGGRNFMKAKSRYRCDDTCERSSELVRLVMIGDEQSEPPPFESEQSWWNEWTREKR
ncbi:unnamed protein product [Angiostrongylus costaricensis]|uniref:Secreted protein n=1 Tax=Angiostrongylus costaricensis TaxID=334426 RepID=A0A0R3PDQ5_ANGCS|nr:unnamed protein product [Angiostrongylus costaricensis]